MAPVAVVAALTQDRRCSDEALEACKGTEDRWWDAARHGVRDRAIGRAAETVLASAAEALRRLPGHQHLAEPVERFAERWTSRGRSPADDITDDLRQHPDRMEELPC